MNRPAKVPLYAGLVSLAALLALILIHKPEILRYPNFWGEDAVQLYADAHRHPLGSIFTPYRGFQLIVLRILALAALAVPPRLVPLTYSLEAAGCMLAVGAYAMSTRLPLNRWGRCLMPVAIGLVPVDQEVYGTLINTQWTVALAMILLLASRPPETIPQTIFDLSLAGLAGLTGPFSILFLPLFTLRALRERTRFDFTLLAFVAVGAFFERRSLDFPRSSGGTAPIEKLFASAGYAPNGLLAFWGRTASTLPWFALGSLVALAFVASQAFRTKRTAALWFIASAVIVSASAIWAYRASPDALAVGRYEFLPEVLGLWTAAAFLPSALSILPFAAAAVSFTYAMENRRSLPDYHWPEESRCLESRKVCKIPVWPPGWYLETDGTKPW